VQRASREAGLHCVQRVPRTERGGRRHTSFVRVTVTPMRADSGRLNPADVEFTFQRGHGKGGQNQNKVASAVRACHRPSGISVFINGRSQCVTVIMAPRFEKMPVSEPALTAEAVFQRDGFVCQYSGQRLGRDELSVDHVVPRDRGGRTEWTNVVTCDRAINSRKGNRLNHEVGLKLLRRPRPPRPTPRCALIRELRHPSWGLFLGWRAAA
jgi:hypothetical protein